MEGQCQATQATHPVLRLNDGGAMPQIGLGLMRFGGEDMTGQVIQRAYAAGYRLYDTASVYRTEPQTGEAIRTLDAARSNIFLTTKLWNADQGGDWPRAALEASLARLGLDYLDLYLIHWPCPEQDLYLETWQALVALKEAGLVRSIGVSNFQVPHLERLIDATGVVPTVNQVEVHPYFQQRELHEFHQRHGIVTQAWSPFGGGGKGNVGALLDDSVIVEIARKYGRSPSQIVLSWHVATGMSVIPKATSEKHLRDNLESVTLTLDEGDLAAIAGLDRADGRLGPDPDTMNFAGQVSR